MDLNRPKLLARIAVCYFAGILVAATVMEAAQLYVLPVPIAPLMFIVVLFGGIPFLVGVMATAYAWAGSIQRRPAT